MTMRTLFTPDPFDVAPAAQRPTRGAWAVLAAGVAFAAGSAFHLERSLSEVARANEAARAQQEAAQLQKKREADARLRAQDPAALERARARAELQQALRMNWSGLFDALERASRGSGGSVSISSLSASSAKGTTADATLAGSASNHDALLQFVDALQREPRVKQATLVSQQLAQSPGAQTVRFQLAVTWEPSR